MAAPSSPESPVWSRGSIHEAEDLVPLERPNLYRYEAAGMLVYDCKARRAGEEVKSAPDSAPKRPLSPATRRELETAEEPDKSNYERRKHYTSYPPFTTDYTLEIPEDVLLFDSHFESGNLARAVLTHSHEYSLYLNYDTETKSHTQWFYFSVANHSLQGTFAFNIVNLMKYDSLYNEGLLPLVKSDRDGDGWKRGGFAVAYYQNGTRKSYTLSFSYTFEHLNDTVYFAHSVPYTFTDLCKYLDNVKDKKTDIARVSPMCKSLAGNVCELITITQNISTYRTHEQEAVEWSMTAAARRLNKQRIERQERLAENIGKRHCDEHRVKQGLVFTARVHPGETPGSFLMKGLLDFLLGDSREAKLIRKHYVCKLVPMLNPDGVRYGNYRCSTLGVDLNRRWACPNRILHPIIYHTKRMIQAFSVWHHIVLFCDFHGHSCKRGVFAYGCARKSCDLEDRKKSLLVHMIPILLSQQTPLFSLKDCHFRMQKSKESTARVVAFKELGIVNSYTVEASFYGPKTGACFTPARSDCHMQQSDYEGLGRELGVVCLSFASTAVFTRKLRAVSEWIREISLNRQGKRQVERSHSLHEEQFPPSAAVSPTVPKAKVPRSAPRLTPAPQDSLSELDCIQEEEDEVLSDALQQNQIWEDLLEQEEALASSGEDAESDSAPSDHGEALRLPSPRLRKLKKKKQTKICKTEPAEENNIDHLPRRSSHQSFKLALPKPLNPSKSPRSNCSVGAFSEALRFSTDQQREPLTGHRKIGRIGEVLRKSVAVREELHLHINSFGKLKNSSNSPLKSLAQEMSNEEYSGRGVSVQPLKPKPFDRPPRPSPPDFICRRLPRRRPLRDGTTIEAVLKALEQRKRSECELGAENSLLALLPKIQAKEAAIDRYMAFTGKGRGSLRLRAEKRF